MKRILIALTALIMVVSLTACGKSADIPGRYVFKSMTDSANGRTFSAEEMASVMSSQGYDELVVCVLREDGSFEMASEVILTMQFVGTWSIDGEDIKLTVDGQDMSGTCDGTTLFIKDTEGYRMSFEKRAENSK